MTQSLPDLETLRQKLQPCKFSIGLGNWAYTPLNKQLTKWISSEGEEIDSSLKNLIDKWSQPWFREEVYARVQDEDWDKLFTKSKVTQDEYEAHFLKGTSIMSLAKNVRKISDEIINKNASSYILDTRKTLNKTKSLITIISEILEDLPENEVKSLNKQFMSIIKSLEETKKLVI